MPKTSPDYSTLVAELAKARRDYHFSRTKENEARKDAATKALVAFVEAREAIR
jgi:hypothetical protein